MQTLCKIEYILLPLDIASNLVLRDGTCVVFTLHYVKIMKIARKFEAPSHTKCILFYLHSHFLYAK